MMTVISRKFARDILLSTAFVLLILIALFAFFDLIGQLDEVGEGQYTIGRAFLFTALSTPSRAYEITPLAALLASVYTMSRWASTSEFTVLRASGYSPASLARAMILPGLVLVLLTFALGEVIGPAGQRYAQELRSGEKATLSARGFSSGAWVRDVTANEAGDPVDRYINVRSISAADRHSTGAWRMFEFSRADGRLLRLVRAESALFTPGRGWELSRATVVHYPKLSAGASGEAQGPVETERMETLFLKSTVDPEILGVMTANPSNMSMYDLRRYIEHMQLVKQDTEHYVSIFWGKAFYPFACFVMLALAMPFAYMNARSGGMAIKIFGGVILGITFYALNNVFGYLSLFSALPAALMAAFPSLVMLALAAASMWWLERR